MQDFLDVVMLDKGLVGIGGYHEAGRNRKPQRGGKFSQECNFATGRGNIFFSEPGQRNDIFRFGNRQLCTEAFADSLINFLIRNTQVLVLFICQDIEVFLIC